MWTNLDASSASYTFFIVYYNLSHEKSSPFNRTGWADPFNWAEGGSVAFCLDYSSLLVFSDVFVASFLFFQAAPPIIKFYSIIHP